MYLLDSSLAAAALDSLVEHSEQVSEVITDLLQACH